MENLIFRGRYKQEGNQISFFNTGSGFSIFAKGKSLTLDLSFEKKPGYIYVIKNHDYEQKKKIYIKNSQKILIPLNEKNPEFIDVFKANESMDNTLKLNKIDCDGDILPNNHKFYKFAKVYGDSTIAGYGILTHEDKTDIDTNDGIEDFCFRTLYELNFDFDIFCSSGWGLTFSSYTTPKDVGIIDYKDKLEVCSKEEWIDKKTPDLLIISLGTNDFSYIQDNPTKNYELTKKFIDSYFKIIEEEKAKNKNLKVIMIYGSLKEENVYPLIEKTYKELFKKVDNLYLVKLTGDNSAHSNHSFVSFHKLMSSELKQKIVEIYR